MSVLQQRFVACRPAGGAEEGPGAGARDVLHGGATPCTV